MLARVESCGLNGLNGFSVVIEADVSGGVPGYELVGLPDAAVKEVKGKNKNSDKEQRLFLSRWKNHYKPRPC